MTWVTDRNIWICNGSIYRWDCGSSDECSQIHCSMTRRLGLGKLTTDDNLKLAASSGCAQVHLEENS
jgi:hypothetical protein